MDTRHKLAKNSVRLFYDETHYRLPHARQVPTAGYSVKGAPVTISLER